MLLLNCQPVSKKAESSEDPESLIEWASTETLRLQESSWGSGVGGGRQRGVAVQWKRLSVLPDKKVLEIRCTRHT